jgi:hypothetical protein
VAVSFKYWWRKPEYSEKPTDLPQFTDKLETTGMIRSRYLKNDRQYNGLKKQDNRIDSYLQNIRQKIKDWATRTPQKTYMYIQRKLSKPNSYLYDFRTGHLVTLPAFTWKEITKTYLNPSSIGNLSRFYLILFMTFGLVALSDFQIIMYRTVLNNL